MDLGTVVNWQYHSATAHFYMTLLSKTTGSNFLCSKYTYNGIAETSAMGDKATGLYRYGNTFRIKDTSYTDVASFKSAMSGVMLVYELATPTTETAEPFAEVQKVDPYGTEEYVSTSIVPVGHYTKYPENLRAKIEGLPTDFSTLIADTEKTTTASKNYAVGDYLIYNNQLYKVTSAIASGATITVGTNVTATTIMAEIKALQ